MIFTAHFHQGTTPWNNSICLGTWLTRLLAVILAAILFLLLPARPSHANITTNTYSSPGEKTGKSQWGIGAVNSYWMETKEGIIIIDGLRSLSEARKVLTQIKKMGKPIIGIFLTHHHPDHVGGIPIFAESAPDAQIYGSRTTVEEIKNDTKGLLKITRQIFGDDFPKNAVSPNRLVKNGDTVRLGEIEIQVMEFAPNEALSMTLLYVPQAQALFTGDLVNNGMTPYIIDGHTSEWIEQLREIAKIFPDAVTIYPGHGANGSKDRLIQRQLEYLKRFRKLIADRLSDDGKISANEKTKIVQAMQSSYPDYEPVAEIPDLLNFNVDAVASELAGQLSMLDR